MTTTLPAPTVEVERASREHVAALMLKAVRDHGLSWPFMLDTAGKAMTVYCDSHRDMCGWARFFGADDIQEPKLAEDRLLGHASVHDGAWFGWSVYLYSHEPLVAAATAALIDEVTAEPAFPDVPWTANPVACACEVVHPLGCPGDTSALVCTCYTDPATCVIDGDPVITGTPAEVAAQIGQHFGREANADECARLNSPLRALDGMGSWTTPFESALPQRTPGAAIDADDLLAEADGIPVDATIDADIDLLPSDLDGPTVVLPPSAVTPCDAELAVEIAHRHDAPQIVEHVTVDRGLIVDGRGGAGAARIGKPIDLTRGTVEGIPGGAE